jgi:hypothetical protein
MALEVRYEFSWEPIRSFKDGNPWTIAFIYPRKEAGFIVKGGFNQIQEWVAASGIKRALIHYTMFGHQMNVNGGIDKTNRSSIHVLTGLPTVQAFVNNVTVDTATGKKMPKNRRWRLSVYTTDGKKHRPFSGDGSTLALDKRLRRPPRCWPKELDQFILPEAERPVKPTVQVSAVAPVAKPKPFVSPCPKCEHAIIELNVGVRGCKLSRYAEKGQNCPLVEVNVPKNVPKVATIVTQKPPMPWKEINDVLNMYSPPEDENSEAENSDSVLRVMFSNDDDDLKF